jgi:hypothetical protein
MFSKFWRYVSEILDYVSENSGLCFQNSGLRFLVYTRDFLEKRFWKTLTFIIFGGYNYDFLGKSR